MGLMMAPLLIAVQSTVPRSQLGVATSVTMFSRTVGGAVGVSLLGAVMTRIMRGQLLSLVPDQTEANFTAVVQNPEVLLQPGVRETLAPSLLIGLREAMAKALNGVFVAGLCIALLALACAFLLPDGLVRDHALSEEPGAPTGG